MNVRTIVAIRLAGGNRPVHVARPVHDVRRLGHVRLRWLFDHPEIHCNPEATGAALDA